MSEHRGSCLCGQVHYVCHGDPIAVGLCLCTHCQKQTSSAFSLVAVMQKDALEIHGELATYRDTGDSGQPVLRSFCPQCGSGIVSDVAIMPDVRIVKAGTFDDTGWLKPNHAIFCDSAQNWVQIPAELQRFNRMPQ